MQSYQPEKRQRRAEPKQMPPAVKYRKKKRRVLNVLVCAVLIALVAIVVIVSPKKPVQKAYYSAGSQDNLVHSTGGALSDYEGLVFSEVMAANRTAMPDENGNYPDWKSGTAPTTPSTSRTSVFPTRARRLSSCSRIWSWRRASA